jgi:predicted membrane protein
MNFFEKLPSLISLYFGKVSEMGDEELLQCNKVRVVVAFFGCFLALCSFFNIIFSEYFVLLSIFAAVLSISSGFAITEILDRKKTKNQSTDD